MITLKVEDYCQNCPYFKPDVSIIGIVHGTRNEVTYETIVFCKDYKNCEKLYEHIKKEVTK